MPQATPTFQLFKYQKPDSAGRAAKHFVWLARTDRIIADVQVLKEGGENNLHSHAHMDGFWFVLGGRVRFYGGHDNQLIAELGKHEGILVPRDFPYWFESAGDEELELLQVEACDIPVPPRIEDLKDRTDYTPRDPAKAKVTQSDGKIEPSALAGAR